MEKKYGKEKDEEGKEPELTGKQKATLILFASAFLVMIFGFIPWGEFGIEMPSFTGILTGATLGNWWFYDAALWFLIISIVIAIIGIVTILRQTWEFGTLLDQIKFPYLESIKKE